MKLMSTATIVRSQTCGKNLFNFFFLVKIHKIQILIDIINSLQYYKVLINFKVYQKKKIGHVN